MKWNPTETQQPHVTYATLGFGLLLLALVSNVLRDRLHLGEAPVGTIFGLIVGPHCLKWVDPTTWGNIDYIVLEVSRFVLVNEVFTVGLDLPPQYMKKQAYSMVMLLVPVMTFGWLISSIFFWKLFPQLRWIDGLAAAGCVTATDPVLSAVLIGNGKFGEELGPVIQDLLSAESAANDGLALPFVYLALNIIKYEHHSSEIALEVICMTILYACVTACVVGTFIGITARYLLRTAMRHSLIDSHWVMTYHFCVVIFCAGVSSVLGLDDLLLAFSAGCALAWDGWFKKEFSHFVTADLITMVFNLAFFFFFGTIIPWDQFNSTDLGIPVWRLICLGVILLFVRRLPIVFAMKPLLPELKTWSDAFCVGHFGPIGVCALFMAKMLKSELAYGVPVPDNPVMVQHSKDISFFIDSIWPITCFLVVTSMIVHGGSVPVYMLARYLFSSFKSKVSLNPHSNVLSHDSSDIEANLK